MRKSRFLTVISALLLILVIPAGCGDKDGEWSDAVQQLSNCSFNCLSMDPRTGVVYAGANLRVGTDEKNMGVWALNGCLYEASGVLSNPGWHIYTLAYDTKHGVLYAGALDGKGYRGVLKYDQSWTDLGGTLSAEGFLATCLSYDPVNEVLYAGVSGTGGVGVWKYDGVSWTDTELDCRVVTAMVVDTVNGVLFAGGANRVCKLEGGSWVDITGKDSKFGVESLAWDSKHEILYAGMSDPHVQGASRGNVWRYDGSNWSIAGEELSGYWISALVYDSRNDVLYAGCNYGSRKPIGVWRYDGDRWVNMGGEVSNYAVRSLAYDPGRNILYAGTDRHGVWSFRYIDKTN